MITEQLFGKRLFVVDAFCSANADSRLKVRFITEVVWQTHFVKNMFIRPNDEELQYFVPDFVVMNGAKCSNSNWQQQGLNSENFIAFNLTELMQLIGGNLVPRRDEKGIFSMMNYLMPLKGIAYMHCSASGGDKGDVAIFFGLSGTGKTTLSINPKRLLIGYDEHGGDDDGVFNFEGACYAKTFKLSEDSLIGYLSCHQKRRPVENSHRAGRWHHLFQRQFENREHPGFLHDLPHPEYRHTGFQGRSRYQGDIPDCRCLRRTAAGITFDRRPDSVPFPIRIHSQTGWHLALRDRTHTDLLRLFRCCFPIVTPNSIHWGADEAYAG